MLNMCSILSLYMLVLVLDFTFQLSEPHQLHIMKWDLLTDSGKKGLDPPSRPCLSVGYHAFVKTLLIFSQVDMTHFLQADSIIFVFW